MKALIFSFCQSKSVMQQQNTRNEKDRIIVNKYMFNNKTVIWGIYHVNAEEAGLLGCCVMWLGNLLPKFWRNLLPSSSALGVNLRTHNPADEGDGLLQNVGKLLPDQMVQQPRRLPSAVWKQVCICVCALIPSEYVGNLATLAIPLL